VGTDHGSGAPVIFFGAALLGGVTGTSPALPVTPTASTQVPLQYDFRQLYSTIMQKWLCMTSAESQTILNGNFATVPIFNEVLLPLDGIELHGSWDNDMARLEFDVYENAKYESFVIERSVNGLDFESIHTVKNISLNSKETYVYKDTRLSNAANVYYRIKGINRQGMSLYSSITRLKNTYSQEVRVYPNPVTNFTITVEFLNRVNGNVDITILGTAGEKLYYNQFNPRGNRTITFRVSEMFEVHTLYILHINIGGEVINQKIFFE